MDSTQNHYDVVIAGAGIAGALSALRLVVGHGVSPMSVPDTGRPLRILLIEKEEMPGGRLRSLAADEAGNQPAWGYGLNGVSRTLLDFWQQTMRADPESSWDPASFQAREQDTLGILSGSELNRIPLDQMLAGKGARALGGMAAARQWDHVTTILSATCAPGPMGAPTEAAAEDDDSAPQEAAAAEANEKIDQQSFADAWKESRKAPAAVVLEQYSPLLGITDIWSTPSEAFRQRAGYHTGPLKRGPWQVAIAQALQKYIDAGLVELSTGCRVMSASFDGKLPDPARASGKGALAEGSWKLVTSKGVFQTSRLVVAQPPWQAVTWLPKHFWPASLLAVTSKVKPVSAVTLTERLEKSAAAELPDLILIPAEGVQAVRSSDDELTFQAVIDYEISVQAPEVVKAVKRLKRARKKLLAACPGSMSENERIALVPVAWGQSASVTETRLIQRMAKTHISSANLAFCGDCYGASYIGDENVVKSVVSATNIIGQSLQP
ncbi:MAG: hypothetical protein RIQ81_1218 [Pseudomonadota bacterium]|jgi:hypothetical protein